MKLLIKRNLILVVTVVCVLTATAFVVWSQYDTGSATNLFAGKTPRTPCAMRSSYDLVKQEKYGIPAPAPQNPDYCIQPVCEGSHEGELVVRYDNTVLLRTGSTTLDIATDDGSPLGVISVGPVQHVRITPSASLYSPDATARFTIYGSGAVGPDDPYGDGPYEQSLRQVTHPVSVSIKAWCGQHSYDAQIDEKLQIRDLSTGKAYTP